MENESKVKNIGIEVVEKDIDLVDGEMVGKLAVKHQGQLGWLKLSLEGAFSAKPFIDTAIDWIEKKIPGDQTGLAGVLKSALGNIKL